MLEIIFLFLRFVKGQSKITDSSNNSSTCTYHGIKLFLIQPFHMLCDAMLTEVCYTSH